MGQQIYRFRKASSLAMLALLVAALAIAGSLFAAPPDAAGQSSQHSPCRKETGTSYHGGKGEPYFTGIPKAESYEPATVVVGKRTVVRNLIDVSNTSETASCDWRVTSKSADWVTLNSESGSLSADSHHTIRVSINDNAKRLRPGIYQARIQFQLGPEADDWYGYAKVTLEILDECYIKVKDTERLDIRDGRRAFSWEGTMGRTQSDSLVHRITVWNSSNSRCRLSVAVITTSSLRWLDAKFQGDGETVIGKGDTASLILSANERWNNLNPGRHRASITIHDAISGAEHQLYGELTAENEPCRLAIAGETSLRFEAVARSVKPQAIQIALENRGVETCEWQVKDSPDWLEVDPGEGKVWGDGGRESVEIKINADAANGLSSSPGEGQPHTGSIAFSYLVRSIPKSLTVPVALHLAKPPCDLQTHTPEDMLIHYTRGEAINPERHHLKIQVSNAEDSQECAYEAKLPNWLETDADAATGTIPEGESREITVRLKAETPEAQAAKQEYDGIIVFAVDRAPDKEVPVTLETGCPAQEPCAYLHTSHIKIHVGDTADISYSLVNPSSQPATAHLKLELPSGWSIDGEGFAAKCSGVCTAPHDVQAGDQKYITMGAYPNNDGHFELKGQVEYQWLKGDETVRGYYLDTISITVLPQEAAPAPQPARNTPTPTPMPTATPTPTPTIPPVAAVLATETPPVPPPVVDLAPDNDQDWSRTDWLLAGVIGSGVLVFIALVIIVGIVLYLFLRPRRQRPAVPPTSQRRPPPGQWSARPAAPNQRR